MDAERLTQSLICLEPIELVGSFWFQVVKSVLEGARRLPSASEQK
jgi:hypothetical protein